jgi:hypothetical protein
VSESVYLIRWAVWLSLAGLSVWLAVRPRESVCAQCREERAVSPVAVTTAAELQLICEDCEYVAGLLGLLREEAVL